MKIPSYDDLAPSIADVHPRDTFDQVTRLVPCEVPVVGRGSQASASAGQRRGLFACLRARGTAAPAALLALARDFTPRLERYGDACVVLDVSGLGRLLGDAAGIAGELRDTAAARGLKLRIAVAPTQTSARLLTCGDQPCVVALDAADALAPLPIEWLQPFEAEPSRTFDALRRWGIRRLGEFAALPSDELTARFGPPGLALQRLAHGIDHRPLVPDPGVPRYRESMTLEWPIDTLEPLAFVLARLLDPLVLALERADRAAAALRLDLRLTDRTTHARVLELPAAMRDPKVLRTLLTLDLESHPPGAGIDAVTLEIDPAPSRIVQFSLLERAVPSPETLATLTARLRALVGEDRCGAPAVLDSHRPDAFAVERFDPRERAGVPLAERAVPLVLRRIRPPAAIRVAVERGRPARVAIDRRGMPGGAVEQAAGPWRSSGGWWDGAASWSRDEWDVALSDGSVCRLVREHESGRWFLDGVLD